MATSKYLLGKTQRRLFGAGCGRWTALFFLNFLALGVSAAYVMVGKSKGHERPNRESEPQRLVSALRSRLDWEQEGTPNFCNEIIHFPQPNRKNCSTAPKIAGAPVCDPTKPMMFSQYGEDYYLYTRHFSKLGRPGVYLDIATNDAIAISNTYFLDRCLSWKGICVEANPRYYERIHRERSCALIPTCLSARDGDEVEFAMSGPGSGIVSTHRQGKQISERANAVVRKRCVSIMPQLARYGVKEIDYLNLDVEGHELAVLNSFDWDAVRIKMISVEIAHNTRQTIEDLLVSKGFVKHNNEAPTDGVAGMPIYPSNEFYVHNSVTFGHPE